MLSFLWGCMVSAINVAIGSFLWFITLVIAAIAGALIVGGIGNTINAWPTKPPKPAPKKPETWQEWKKEQDGELKSLIEEIDKDLK